MRALSIPTPRQLSLRLGDEDPIERVWDSLPAATRERVLRVLAHAIALMLAEKEEGFE